MAKATKVQAEYEINLNLNKRESEVLMRVFNLVGGHPDTTARGVVNNIREELVRAGVKAAPDRVSDHGCDITFV